MGFIFLVDGRHGTIHVSGRWWCQCGMLQLSVCWGVLCQGIQEAAQGCHSHGCVVGGAAIWGETEFPCESWVVATVYHQCFSDIPPGSLVDPLCWARHPSPSRRDVG